MCDSNVNTISFHSFIVWFYVWAHNASALVTVECAIELAGFCVALTTTPRILTEKEISVCMYVCVRCFCIAHCSSRSCYSTKLSILGDLMVRIRRGIVWCPVWLAEWYREEDSLELELEVGDPVCTTNPDKDGIDMFVVMVKETGKHLGTVDSSFRWQAVPHHTNQDVHICSLEALFKGSSPKSVRQSMCSQRHASGL